MTAFGYHCSHEQIPPSRLLRHALHAQDAGFDAAMCSDHLAPWLPEQGHSGYAFAWLGAALQATDLPYGMVTAPGQRTHPVTTAQALATLAEMAPGRFWAALGSGEALNEHITGDPWPDHATRRARLRECVEVIRALLAGEEVSHNGLVTVDRARIWSLPAEAPALIAAAVSPESAAEHAAWADGLITVGCDPRAAAKVLEAYREAGGRGPARLQVHLAFAPTDAEALAMTRRHWRNAAVTAPDCWDIDTPEALARRADGVTDEQLEAGVIVSSDASIHRDRLAELADVGFDALMLHQVGADESDQAAFIDVFGERVLPELRGAE